MRFAAGTALSLFTVVLAASLSAQEGPAERRDEKPPSDPPEIRLVDQNGKPFDLQKDRDGRPVLLTFIFTRCPGACPLVMEKSVAAATKAASAKDARRRPLVVGLSFDPEHDTPKVLRAYAKERGFERKHVALLTGDAAVVKKIVEEYGVSVGRNPDDGSIFHGFQTVVIDRAGKIVARYYGYDIDSKALAEDARKAGEPVAAVP